MNDLSLKDLKRIQTVLYEIVGQIGKLAISDYNILLVGFPNALSKEIQKREENE